MALDPYQAPATTPIPPPLPPLAKSPWNGWWTLLWAVILIIAWQTIASIGVLIAAFQQGIMANPGSADFERDILELAMDGDVVGLTAFATIFFVCPICWILGQVRPGFTGWSYLGHARIKWWHWPVWGAATLALNFAFSFVAPSIGIDGPDDSMVKMATTTNVPLFLYLGVGIGAPLVEEFMFRGTLWTGWRHSKMGLMGALVLTSFCWAILHVQYPTAIICFIFFFGIVLGLAREATGNLWIPIWMHALNNGLATIEMLRL